MFFIMILFATLFLMLGLMWMARPQHVDEDELPTPLGDVHQVAWTIGGPKRVLATWWALLRADGVVCLAHRAIWSLAGACHQLLASRCRVPGRRRLGLAPAAEQPGNLAA